MEPSPYLSREYPSTLLIPPREAGQTSGPEQEGPAQIPRTQGAAEENSPAECGRPPHRVPDTIEAVRAKHE
jgi:hypothetical protein